MTPTKTNDASSPAETRSRRRRPPVYVRPTLEPITPSYLIAQRRVRARIAAGAPLMTLAIGIGLISAHTAVPIGVVVLGVVLVVGSLVIGLVNLYVGSPLRVLRSLLVGYSVQPSSDQLNNLLEGLCVGNGLPVPAVRIVNDRATNVIVLGWSERSATLVITTGLLDTCSRIELEGLLAHELTHIKSGDLRDAAFASIALGAMGLVSDWASRGLGVLLQPAREANADLGGASMTRYPPGLMKGLVTIRGVGELRPQQLSKTTARLTAPLWLVQLQEAVPRRPRTGVLDLDDRIGLLAEL